MTGRGSLVSLLAGQMGFPFQTIVLWLAFERYPATSRAAQHAAVADAASGPEIGAFLKAGFGPSAFPISCGGAAKRQPVGRLFSCRSLYKIKVTQSQYICQKDGSVLDMLPCARSLACAASWEILMGGIYWEYFVPYQRDIQQAFMALRQQVFSNRDYRVMPPPAAGMTFEQFCTYFRGVELDQLSEEERQEEEALFRRWNMPFEPTTIETLLEWNGSDGTGTILDITSFDILEHLTNQELLATFGTLQPDRHLLEAAGVQILGVCAERGLAVYVIVYAHGKPSELFFAGLTGD